MQYLLWDDVSRTVWLKLIFLLTMHRSIQKRSISMLATYPIFAIGSFRSKHTCYKDWNCVSRNVWWKWYLIFKCPGISCVSINRSRTMSIKQPGKICQLLLISIWLDFFIFSTVIIEFNWKNWPSIMRSLHSLSRLLQTKKFLVIWWQKTNVYQW